MPISTSQRVAGNTNEWHWNYLRDCLFPAKSKQELTSNPNVVNIEQQPEIINAVARAQFIYSIVPLRVQLGRFDLKLFICWL